MSVPAIIVRIELERRPVVVVDIADDAEERRLLDWVRHQPRVLDLINDAIALASEKRAA